MKRFLSGAILAFFIALPALALAEAAGSATALKATYERLRPELEQSPFGKPIHLESKQQGDRLRGNIHAVLDQPFERVRAGLGRIDGWCNLLILHPNITNCRISGPNEVTIYLGRNGSPVTFTYQTAADTSDYLHLTLHADEGPAGTSDFRIDVEATPLDAQRTILHLDYSHAYGLQAKMAMRAYLGTFGRGKVGFTVIDHTPDGKPVYVGGVRGALERNAMRYYICVEAYVDALALPPGEQLEHRLKTWYAYTERYPLQLREEDGYLDAKRRIARSIS